MKLFGSDFVTINHSATSFSTEECIGACVIIAEPRIYGSGSDFGTVIGVVVIEVGTADAFEVFVIQSHDAVKAGGTSAEHDVVFESQFIDGVDSSVASAQDVIVLIDIERGIARKHAVCIEFSINSGFPNIAFTGGVSRGGDSELLSVSVVTIDNGRRAGHFAFFGGTGGEFHIQRTVGTHNGGKLNVSCEV